MTREVLIEPQSCSYSALPLISQEESARRSVNGFHFDNSCTACQANCRAGGPCLGCSIKVSQVQSLFRVPHVSRFSGRGLSRPGYSTLSGWSIRSIGVYHRPVVCRSRNCRLAELSLFPFHTASSATTAVAIYTILPSVVTGVDRV